MSLVCLLAKEMYFSTAPVLNSPWEVGYIPSSGRTPWQIYQPSVVRKPLVQDSNKGNPDTVDLQARGGLKNCSV